MRFLLRGEKIITAETPFYHENMEYTARRVAPELWESFGLQELVETPRADERYYWITERIELGELKIYYDKTPKDLDQIKAWRVQQIKEEAQVKIYEKLPIWRQTNLISAGVKLLYARIENGNWTSDEETLVNGLLAQIAKTEALRAHSNAMEAELNALQTIEEIEAWTTHDWPEL